MALLAQTDGAQCWEPIESSGGEYYNWGVNTTDPCMPCIADFCGTWHEGVPAAATPYKPRGKQWEIESADAMTPPACEKLVAAPRAIASQGSSMHASGRCKPCAWYWKSVGCSKGQDCIYCHLCLEGELKMRRKAKLAAFRSGQPANDTPEPPQEKEHDVELSEEQLAVLETPNSAEAAIATPVLPIQLESLLPEATSSMRVVGHVSGDFVPMAQQVAADAAATSEFSLAGSSSSLCVYPSLPRSAPPCSPPLIQNFDVTPPPPPLQDSQETVVQDPSACEQWQWHHASWLDGSAWLGYTQEHACVEGVEGDMFAWQATQEYIPALPQTPPSLRISQPEVVGDGKTLWRLPLSSTSSGLQNSEARVLLVTRGYMINAWEVLDETWDPNSNPARSSSCPAEFRSIADREAAVAPRARAATTPTHQSDSSAQGRPVAELQNSKNQCEIGTPTSRRQVRGRASQPARMVWRKKSADSLASQQEELPSESSPSHRGGRPRVGRAGPRGPVSPNSLQPTTQQRGPWLEKYTAET
jgi:hypothetical protein